MVRVGLEDSAEFAKQTRRHIARAEGHWCLWRSGSWESNPEVGIFCFSSTLYMFAV